VRRLSVSLETIYEIANCGVQVTRDEDFSFEKKKVMIMLRYESTRDQPFS
jgi:hypothetical protein